MLFWDLILHLNLILHKDLNFRSNSGLNLNLKLEMQQLMLREERGTGRQLAAAIRGDNSVFMRKIRN